MLRLFGKDKDENHEIEHMVKVDPPQFFMVVIEAETEDGEPLDFALAVPFASINHVTYVLAINGVPHRVEPLEG